MNPDYRIPERFYPAIEAVVHQMGMGNYAALATDGHLGRIKPEQLKSVLERGVGTKKHLTLLDLPAGWAGHDAARAIHIAYQTQWSVDVPLWTMEEGESDLALELIIKEVDGRVQVTIQDCHTLLIPERFYAAIEEVVHQLVIGNYEGLAADGRLGPVTAEEMKSAFAIGVDTGKYFTLLELPPGWARMISSSGVHLTSGAYYIAKHDDWAVDVPLWTVEEGESDLTLQLIIKEVDGQVQVTIEDCHML